MELYNGSGHIIQLMLGPCGDGSSKSWHVNIIHYHGALVKGPRVNGPACRMQPGGS
jgi:hypothetical protein